MGSASYFRNENLVKINISDSINDSEKKLIEKEFLEKTGINIEIILPGKQDKTENLPVQKLDYQMEQNQALNLIDDAFKDKEDKPYKKSLKAIDGEPCIELSFISPVIGNKYRDLIDELESRTRWPIRVNPVPNQNELLNVGIRLLQEHGISLKKNLSYFPREMQVRAVVNNRDDEVLNNVKNLYKEKTGAELIIE